jgi:predicted O-methyltransferase YrrM
MDHKINNYTENRPEKLSPDHGFRLHYMTLYSIVYGMEAKNVFEFGCGHSSKVILDALKETGGKLTTVEMRDIEEIGNNKEVLEKESGRWRFINKDSTQVVKHDIKDEAFDVVLHDGAHEVKLVIKDIRGIVRRMKQDGILLVHDTNHKAFPYLRLAIRIGLFPYRYEMVTLPYGAGLSIVRLKSNFGNGQAKFTWKKGEITKMGPNT